MKPLMLHAGNRTFRTAQFQTFLTIFSGRFIPLEMFCTNAKYSIMICILIEVKVKVIHSLEVINYTNISA